MRMLDQSVRSGGWIEKTLYLRKTADLEVVVLNGPVGDYFYINDVKQTAYQIVEFEGSYYLIAENNKIVKNTTRNVQAAWIGNYDIVPFRYEFDADGKMLIPETVYYVSGSMNGWAKADAAYALPIYKEAEKEYKLADVALEAGDEFNVIDNFGRKYLTANYAIDKDGTYNIYFRPEHTGSASNGWLEKTVYTRRVSSLIPDGPNVDGKFYVEDEAQKAYKLIEFDNDWYFIAEYNKYVVSSVRYLNSSVVAGTNFAEGYYEFDAYGRMVVKNGPNADGYFYVNNVKQLAYQLVEFEGDWYYISTNNKYTKNSTKTLTADKVEGTPFAPGKYEFGADGKMIIKNGPVGDYFYVNDVLQKAYKVCEYNGDYYLVAENHKIAKNCSRNVQAAWIGDLDIEPGRYEFDADGKMILPD